MGPGYRPAEARDEPFIWVTWLTKLISGDAQCEWSLWFRARHSFDKLEAGSTLDGWTKDHNLLVDWRVRKLREMGLRPRVEQGFTVNGKTATVKGKADIVYEQDGSLWIEECKTGIRRESDHVQALIYIWLAEMNGNRTAQARLVYKDQVVDVDRSGLTKVRSAGIRLVALTVNPVPPARQPSASECRSCNIGPTYCDDRMASEDEIFVTDEF